MVVEDEDGEYIGFEDEMWKENLVLLEKEKTKLVYSFDANSRLPVMYFRQFC